MEIRLIDAEALIRAIHDLDGVEGHEKLYYRIANMVVAAPTITQPNEWVNAKDNPPQLTGKYICCVEDTHGYMWSIPADYLLEMKTWVGEFGEIKNKVVYWMPLPAPPEKEE